jgi:hypothetical protein
MSIFQPFVLAAASVAPMLALSNGATGMANSQPKPLIEVVRGLEKAGFGPIVDVSWDDGAWEVEAYRGNEPLELAVDPYNGKVVSEHRDDAESRPQQEAMKLSKVLLALENAGHSNIEEISFERRYWEVESIVHGAEQELHVDPVTAEIISSRLED